MSLFRRGESWHELGENQKRDYDFAAAIKHHANPIQIERFRHFKINHPEAIQTTTWQPPVYPIATSSQNLWATRAHAGETEVVQHDSSISSIMG